jgi:hypothetical protein
VDLVSRRKRVHQNRYPVLTSDSTLPNRSFWTNAVTTGPRWIKKENYPFTAIPVFVKENSVLLLGPDSVDVPDYEYAKVGLEVRAYQVPSDAEVVVQVPSGKGPEWAGKVVLKGGKAEGQGVKVDSVADMQEKEGL